MLKSAQSISHYFDFLASFEKNLSMTAVGTSSEYWFQSRDKVVSKINTKVIFFTKLCQNHV